MITLVIRFLSTFSTEDVILMEESRLHRIQSRPSQKLNLEYKDRLKASKHFAGRTKDPGSSPDVLCLKA